MAGCRHSNNGGATTSMPAQSPAHHTSQPYISSRLGKRPCQDRKPLPKLGATTQANATHAAKRRVWRVGSLASKAGTVRAHHAARPAWDSEDTVRSNAPPKAAGTGPIIGTRKPCQFSQKAPRARPGTARQPHSSKAAKARPEGGHTAVTLDGPIEVSMPTRAATK